MCGADKLWVVLKPISIELDEDEDAVSLPPSSPPSLPASLPPTPRASVSIEGEAKAF